MANLKRNLLNGTKVVGAVIGSALVGEATYSATRNLEADAEGIFHLGKYVVSPTPYLVKKGFFGRKQVVKQNPITGKISPYTGKKEPVNKKAYRI